VLPVLELLELPQPASMDTAMTAVNIPATTFLFIEISSL